MKAVWQLALVLLVTAAIVGTGMLLLKQGHNRAAAAAARAARSHTLQHRMQEAVHRQPACSTLPAGPLAGVAVKTPIGRNFADAAQLAGAHFALAEFYVRFGRPFPTREALEAATDGAVPVIQLNPRTVSLAAIAAGQWDRYLHTYAAATASFGCRVVLSFAHEMNGAWYPWGCGHVQARTFIAAWRRVHADMAAARNITWMWTTNVGLPGAHCSVASHWPGTSYVDWVGIDGYLRTPDATFTGVFGKTLQQVARLAPGKPVVIAEVGATPGARIGSRILDIYQGAIKAGAHGVIYFDTTGKLADYQPQQNPAALAAFRQGVALYENRNGINETHGVPRHHSRCGRAAPGHHRRVCSHGPNAK